MRRLIALACIVVGLSACGPSSAASVSAPPASISAPSVSPSGLDSCSGNCPHAAAVDGPFRLELVLPRVEWKSDEPLTGTVTLFFDGSKPTKISGATEVLNFAYAEVGGSHKVEPAWRTACVIRDLDPATPMSIPLGKSGGFSDEDPDAAWLRAFLTAPDVRLLAGTWDVTAVAEFTEGDRCGADGHSMAATVRVTVSD